MQPFTVHDLEKRVEDRAKADPGTSYTRTLVDKGVAHCAKKLGEEAVEVTIAAVSEDRGRLVAETADLLYHLLVLLQVRGISFAEVEAVLGERTRQSGLEEKAARKGG
jgi:phosphoribosyl-ATP pyrophosphohydrolase